MVTTVGILALPDLAEAATALRDLVGWLHARGLGVCLERRTAALVADCGSCRIEDGRELVAVADVLVVLGGDGTLLAASQLVAGRQVPVLGVNFGSLGFLTETTLAELYPALAAVLDGSYQYDERRMLRVEVTRSDGSVETGDVLNDAVITKAAVSRIIELDVTIGGLFVSAFRADGLIVSSPTGSTAYNLAAGGPILHPSLDAVVLTPICPHMLTNRPLVVSDAARIEVRLHTRDLEMSLTLDGQRSLPLSHRDTLAVTRSPHTLRLVRAPSRDYFEVLRTKLKWGESSARRR